MTLIKLLCLTLLFAAIFTVHDGKIHGSTVVLILCAWVLTQIKEE